MAIIYMAEILPGSNVQDWTQFTSTAPPHYKLDENVNTKPNEEEWKWHESMEGRFLTKIKEAITERNTKNLTFDLKQHTSGNMDEQLFQKLLKELKSIIRVLHFTFTFEMFPTFPKEPNQVPDALNKLLETANGEWVNDNRQTSYNTLLTKYRETVKELLQEKNPDNIFWFFILNKFLFASFDFLQETDEKKPYTYKEALIVKAFYEVFIKEKPPVDSSGGRKRISKSFQNSRIRRKSHRRRRTVKSHRRVKSRRRRSVKRRRRL